MTAVPLAVLDLVPISSGSTAAQALRNSIDLAQAAEQAGYARYWFAEHHLNPGVAGTSPAVVLALTAAATSRIRIGSGAVQMGHRTALSTVEEFGLIDALHLGRLDRGLGRSGGRPRQREPALAGTPGKENTRTPNGLLIPPRFSVEHLLGTPRFHLQKTLLQLPGADELIITTITHDHADPAGRPPRPGREPPLYQVTAAPLYEVRGSGGWLRRRNSPGTRSAWARERRE
jgi:alkanesulfonate monooxygenase SsuD/methylene tetrahydromethanopterin reductase-like flavin-dependent oxidoreductase (luciferase family)